MRVLLILAFISAFAFFAKADDCGTYSTSAPEISLLGYYEDTDFCQPDCGPYFWIYEESNGIAGLQRGDEVVDDTCHGMIQPDTILF